MRGGKGKVLDKPIVRRSKKRKPSRHINTVPTISEAMTRANRGK